LTGQDSRLQVLPRERRTTVCLAEEFVQRCQRGERPSLDEYTARYPELADEIRELFPALALMQDVRPQPGAATGPYEGGQCGASGLERLGDYRILREVGRGGMGIVYEAEQESLGRHVALKVLPAHTLLDPQRLQRFQREARAAARLHHTNIVPVYGVGEQDGLHYYVLQFIQGLALDEVLVELKKLRRAQQGPATTVEEIPPSKRRDRVSDVSAVEVAQALLTGDFVSHDQASRERPLPPTGEGGEGSGMRGSLLTSPLGGEGVGVRGKEADPPPASDAAVRLPGSSGQSSLSESGRQYWQSVARLGIQVAKALAYAHGQGTLHRDINPSNLLLDTRGTVWVTDFGLAKAADSDNLTHTGDLVGTLRYMAPERFEGQSDLRSDLYALGLTLYELLTLQPIFVGSDRNRLIDRVKHEEPPRLRKLNPDVPRDLETIVLKAMAKEPGHRYQTAAALAEDLKRFVEDKPIRARRVSSVERLWRWCRRNRLVAGLTAVVALLLVTVAVVSVMAAVHLNAARTEADRQADAARNHAEKEEQNRTEAEARLARRYVSNGVHALERGDLFGSLPWFVEALKTDQNDPVRAENLRIRLRAVLQQCPRARFFFQEGRISQAELSPDGRRLLTTGSRWIASEKRWRADTRIWDVDMGRFVPLHTDRLEYMAFSADGCRVVTGTTWSPNSGSGTRKGEARVWDAVTGKPLGPPFRSPDWFALMSSSRAFSSDGRRIVTIQGRCLDMSEGVRLKSEAQVWDLVTGKAATVPLKYDGDRGLEEAFFSPDGRRVYLRGWRWIAAEKRDEAEEQIWDVATARPLTPLLRRGARGVFPPSAVFSTDGKRVRSYNPSTADVWIWDPTTGQVIWYLDGSEQATREVADLRHALLSPDGRRLLTVGSPGRVHVWAIAARKRIGESFSHKGEISPVVSQNGRRMLTVIHQEGGREEVRARRRKGATRRVGRVRVAPCEGHDFRTRGFTSSRN
jgi:serine/threonine protein kinase